MSHFICMDWQILVMNPNPIKPLRLLKSPPSTGKIMAGFSSGHEPGKVCTDCTHDLEG